MTPHLAIEELSLSFHQRPALEEISFSLQKGETLALVGESGAGKSALARSLLGLHPSYATLSGKVLFEGKNLLSLCEKEWRELRGGKIGMAAQDPTASLNPTLSVGKQIYEGIRLHTKKKRKVAREEVYALLDELTIPDPEMTYRLFPHQLSGGMRQRVLLAIALASSPSLLIADEPTTALDPLIQEETLQLLMQIQRKRKMSLLLISHDLTMVESIADQIIVMQKGRIAERGESSTLFAHPTHPYTQSLLEARLTHSPQQEERSPSPQTELLVVQEVSRTYRRRNQSHLALHPLSFSLKEGEILGIVGESGSGKSTLARLIAGLDEPTTGTLSIDGHSPSLRKSERLERARLVQMVFQDPLGALNPKMRIQESLAEPYQLHHLATSKELASTIQKTLQRFELTPAHAIRYPNQLSGGELQRVNIARALSLRPRLLVCDEPTSALDASVQRQILDLLLQLREEESLTLLVISHDLAVIRYLADRVGVLRRGQLVELGDTEAIFETPSHDYTRQLIS